MQTPPSDPDRQHSGDRLANTVEGIGFYTQPNPRRWDPRPGGPIASNTRRESRSLAGFQLRQIHDPAKQTRDEGSPISESGTRRWATYEELDWDEDDFAEIGAAFSTTGAERVCLVGAATARLMPMRALVDFATSWMQTNRH